MIVNTVACIHINVGSNDIALGIADIASGNGKVFACQDQTAFGNVFAITIALIA